MVSDRELFELRNGRVIMDEDLSEKCTSSNPTTLRKRTKTVPGLSGRKWVWQTCSVCSTTGKLDTALSTKAGTPTLKEHDMTRWQYEDLQEQLSRKMRDNPYGKNGNYKYEEGYKQGILAAKSVLSNFYHRLEEENENV